MKTPSREEQRRLVRLWDTVGPLLDQKRREELRNKPYDWREVDALLSLADDPSLPPRTTDSFAVVLQREFMKCHPRALERARAAGLPGLGVAPETEQPPPSDHPAGQPG